ncbi:lysoplasmalogenase [Sphingomonas sp. ERG5]|uniref:lysoplasmalogenase n=1 Tax=Sphingomonas sp. ERG5 TaxID=1381597 RepID=UPI00054C5340|nr:lysoplasmalogenase [Sphingomonas sp. ERG5]
MSNRLLFTAALIAGTSYYFVDHVLAPGTAAIVWKGAGVGLLALWAATQARDRAGWLITVVLALGALGDVLLETSGLTVGALAFLAGHLVAVALYLTHRRATGATDWAVAAVVLVATPVAAWLLPTDRSAAPGIALYATGLGAMAASAWLSRFPRTYVGLGALLFVLSDLLIFSRIGPLSASPIPNFLIWPTYFGGQALIAWGVVAALDRTRPT